MKLTKDEILRLREISAKAFEDRSDDEKKELSALLAKAADGGEDVSALLAKELNIDEHVKASRTVKLDDNDDDLTADAVKALVTESVTAAIEGKGVSAEVVKALTDKLESLESVKPEDIKSAIADALGGNGNDVIDVQKAITEGLKNFKPEGSVSKEDFDKAIVDLKSSFNAGQKNQFSASGFKMANGIEIDFPTEHRAGNLNVAEKQLLNVMMNGTPGMKQHQLAVVQNEGIPESTIKFAATSGARQHELLRKSIKYGSKAIVTGTATSGEELIATDLSSELLNRMYLESQVAAEFVSSEIDMPTQTFNLPIRTTRPTFLTGSENPGSDPSESSPGTGEVVLTAQKLIGKTNFSYEAEEDAIIAVLPMVTENLASAAADALENAIINGDTTATHQDSDTHAVTNDAAKLFKGLRKYAIAGSLDRSLTTGGISDTNVLTLKKDMGRWGVQKPQDLLIICGVKGYADFIGLPETLTADLTGNPAGARINTGVAPMLFGSKILVSSRVRENLTSAGIYDGVTTTKGSFLVVHRPSWIMGVRSGFTVEIDRDVQQQINIVVASFRRDFKPLETPSASLPYVAMGRDYTA